MPPAHENLYQAPQEQRGPAPASQGNGMAVASLVCGLMCCVTPIPAVLAMVFGGIAIRRSRDPGVSGRAMAATGLALGLTGVILWVLVGVVFGFSFRFFLREMNEAETAAETFVQNLADGKIDAAMAMATPGVEREKLVKARERMKPWGSLTYLRVDYKPDQAAPTPENAIRLRWLIEGVAVFSRASPEISMSVIRQGDVYKVERFDMR